MQLELVLNLIRRKVQDSSYVDEDYIDWINVCVGEIASTEVLPYLTDHDEFTLGAGEWETSLPGDFYSNLFSVQNLTDGQGIRIHKLSELLISFPDLSVTGSVRHVAISGQEGLIFQRAPAVSTNIRVWYSKSPDKVTSSNLNAPCIPQFLQPPLFVNFVCSQIFTEISDGSPGNIQDSAKLYYEKYMNARIDLRQYLGIPEGPPEFISHKEISSTGEEI